MDDLPEELSDDSSMQPRLVHGRWQRLLLAIGSAGLLAAMATDALAVAGRHLGIAVRGAIEIFQVCAVVAISSAILLATMVDRHAHVDLIFGRLPARWQTVLLVVGRLSAVATFALLAIGSAWVALELWPAHEITDALAIPIAPFRIWWTLCCTAAAFVSAGLLVREWRR